MNKVLGTALLTLLMSCVTINIYFPEAEAQEAADRIIDEVRGADGTDLPRTGALAFRDFRVLLATGAARLLEVLVPSAVAQANFDAASPATRALEQSLKARFPGIKPHLDAGVVGLTSSGLLEVRDLNAIPLSARNAVRQLVAAQNTDWEALYKEIARINGHPEWIDQIRQLFAQRWVAKASAGWYYRDTSGSWQKK
jgi:uncharacterized protein YdbL (DUF1318 family)